MLKKKITLLSNKGTIGNLFTLVSGTTIAQFFSLIFYPIFGRIFTPEDFGLLSALNTVAAIIAVIASGKYEQAIIVTRNRGEAINVAVLALLSATILCCFIFIAMLLFSEPILVVINNTMLIGWVQLSPIIALFIIIYNVFNEWCVKKGAFSSLAVNKITNSASISLSKFGLGIVAMGGGLAFGEMLGRGISALSCVLHWVRVDRADFKLISWQKIKETARLYIDFPKYTMPEQVINTLAGSTSLIFILSYFGDRELGYYAMTQNILAIPMAFVGQAVMDVFRNRASIDFENSGSCRLIYRRMFRKITPIVFIAMIGIFFFLPSCFVFVLGEKWRVAGELAQLLFPSIAIGFLNNVFMSVWIIAGKLKQRLYWQISHFCMILITMLMGCVVYNNMWITVCFLSVGLGISYSISLYFTWCYSQNK